MQKISGETITGIALIGLALLFLYAGTVNEVWRKLMLADLVILILGIAFTVLGLVTTKRSNKHSATSSEHKH